MARVCPAKAVKASLPALMAGTEAFTDYRGRDQTPAVVWIQLRLDAMLA
jgi:hypothetical protein